MRVFDTPMRVWDTPMLVFDTPMRVWDTPMLVLDTPMRVLDTPMRVLGTRLTHWSTLARQVALLEKGQLAQLFDEHDEVCLTLPINITLSRKSIHPQSRQLVLYCTL